MTEAHRGRRRPSVLVIASDTLGDEMAGPAIRAYELARVMSAYADVRLAATGLGGALDLPAAIFNKHDGGTLEPHLESVDMVVTQPLWPLAMRALRRSGAQLVFDLYDPEMLEALAYLAGRNRSVRRLIFDLSTDRVMEALRIGSRFVCASEEQRALWLGAMVGDRLLRPASYDRDPGFRATIDTVPFGAPSTPPARTGASPWDGLPGVEEGDEVVLWNGGIWSWLDAATAIRAVARLAERRPRAKLVFMGSSSHAAARRATAEARALAEELGVLGRHVFFNDRWVPYAERGDWLLAADCALSCHLDQLEARFAFRTRLVDCFWAGLPVVCTRGDTLAAEVERDGLGRAVPEQDPDAVAAALEDVLERGRAAYAPALARAAERRTWPLAAAPLVRWLHEPPAPRLGEGIARRPEHALRSAGYKAARGALNALGVRGWPRI